MEKIIEFLPPQIETAALVLLVMICYKIYSVSMKWMEANKKNKREFTAQVQGEEREKSYLDKRITVLEGRVDRLDLDLKEHKSEYSAGFQILSAKIDRMNELLLEYLVK